MCLWPIDRCLWHAHWKYQKNVAVLHCSCLYYIWVFYCLIYWTSHLIYLDVRCEKYFKFILGLIVFPVQLGKLILLPLSYAPRWQLRTVKDLLFSELVLRHEFNVFHSLAFAWSFSVYIIGYTGTVLIFVWKSNSWVSFDWNGTDGNDCL